ncbi:MAG TPA: HIT domain-containing protein [Candidatus Binatia bacterium]|nr:HIT domain-containing protein [Candidatus Binatia bacterium]
MKQLWAPWRMVYINQASTNEGCVFCQKMREQDTREALVLAHTGHSVIMLNKYPYANGHLLLAPKRHERHLASLSAEEYGDLNEALRRSVKIIQQSYRPAGINLGMNLGKCAGAGIEDHLHWHVVPRWDGDNNFMPVLAETRVMPQLLLESYDQLKPYFQGFGE